MKESHLRLEYLQMLPRLEKITKTVEDMLDPLSSDNFILETNIKPLNSVKRKILERKYDHLSDLTDLVRGRLYFSDKYTFLNVVETLKNIFHDYIKNIDFKNEKEDGLLYRGLIHIDMKINNINFELQVLPIEFKPYKELLHHIYDMLRDNNSLSDAQKDFMKKLHNRIFDELLQISEKNRQHL